MIERVYIALKEHGGMADAQTIRVLCGAQSVRMVEVNLATLAKGKRVVECPPEHGRPMWRAV